MGRNWLSVKQLRYGAERLNNQDRAITVKGAGGKRVVSWRVDEENNLFELTLED